MCKDVVYGGDRVVTGGDRLVRAILHSYKNNDVTLDYRLISR